MPRRRIVTSIPAWRFLRRDELINVNSVFARDSIREAGIDFVSELCHMPRETPVKHGDLRGHSDAHRCCGRSLIGSALLRVGVRY